MSGGLSIGPWGSKIQPEVFWYLVCGVPSAIILLIDLAMPLGVAVGALYIVVVLLSLRSPQKRFTLLVAVCTSLLVIIGFFYSPSGSALIDALLNRAIALLAIWSTALLGLQMKVMARQREKALAERAKAVKEVKTLRGFLPICASCKRIRDDRGYWRQIESYIRDHSEADFSHGICPQCLEKLYPEFQAEDDPGGATDT